MSRLHTRRDLAGLAAVLMLSGAPGMSETRPDFSNVTSREQAQRLAAQGQLVRILLFPAEYGGEDIEQNAVYVPPAIVPVREALIGTLGRMIEAGQINKLEVTPEYSGSSFVPTRIRMHAWHDARSGEFSPVIEIWSP